MKQIGVIFFLGFVFFLAGFLLGRPYYIKKIKKPEVGVKREKKSYYIKDGLDIIFYYKILTIMIIGVFLMILSIVFFIMRLFD